MNNDPNQLLVEARARIIWGDEPSTVRYYLTTNGMSAADADAKLRDFILERKVEVRKLGIRDVLIGVALLAFAGIFLCSYTKSLHNGNPAFTFGNGKGCALMVMVAFYGIWKLISGGQRLIRPKSEHGSIPDISE